MMNWIRFSLRSVLALIAFAAVACAWLFPMLFPKPIPDLHIAGGHTMSCSAGGRSHTKQFSAELTPATFNGVRPWFRETPNPPVASSDAMLIAQQYYQDNLSSELYFDGLSLDYATLKPFDHEYGYWYWSVSFVSVGAGGFHPYIDLVVLMDGSVVKPDVTERTDLGWPLPYQPAPRRPEGLTDQRIVQTFVDELNPKRTFAGQFVDVVGRLSLIPAGHPHNKTGRGLHLILSDGTILIVESHSEWLPKLDIDRKVRAQLIGIRSRHDRDPEWDGLTLFPAVRW